MYKEQPWDETTLDAGPEDIDLSSRPVPAGDYLLQVIDARGGTTQKGGKKVVLDYKIAALYDKQKGDYLESPHAGRKIRFHSVGLFFTKESQGFGIMKHNLKSFGQPYQGEIRVQPNNFIGRLVLARVVIDDEGKYNNVDWITEGVALPESERARLGIQALGPVEKEEEVPF